MSDTVVLSLATFGGLLIACLLWLNRRRRNRPFGPVLSIPYRSPSPYALETRPLAPVSGVRPVALGASALSAARAGDSFTARFVAYAEDYEDEVREKLEEMSPRSRSHLGIKHCRWPVGTRVQVRLHGDHIVVSPDCEEFEWEGNYIIVDFDVVLSAKAEHTTVLKFDVAVGGIVVARIRLDVAITANPPHGRTSVFSQPARTAFASYASDDRLRVLDRLAEVSRSGVDVFVDCLSLHPGDEWKPTLESEIVERELFLLFWSARAQRSPWVTWEWQTALRRKGLTAIDPHPLDPVFEAAPPKELASLHFGDPYVLARKAYASQSASGSTFRRTDWTGKLRCIKCNKHIDAEWVSCPYCERSVGAP